MPKPPARKPLFCPPVSTVTKEEVTTRPKPGEKGWLEDMAKKMKQRNSDQDLPASLSLELQKTERPKPGEKGWLVALADSLETTSTQELVLSSSQQSDVFREVSSGEGSSQQVGSQEGIRRPKPGEPGWLVAIVDNMENSSVQQQELSSSQQSRDMSSSQSSSQELQRPKPGGPGWLVSLTERMEEDSSTPQLQDKMEKTKPSQDSGKGKSLVSHQTIGQANKTSVSQVSTSQSSVSSAFQLLASEEVTSQVLLYQEEVVRLTQASQQEVAGDDMAAVVEESGDEVTGDEKIENTLVGDEDAVDEVNLAAQDATSNTTDTANFLTKAISLEVAPTSQLGTQTTSSSQLSGMLDKILSDMKSNVKKTAAEQVITETTPTLSPSVNNIPSLDIMSVPITQTEDSSPLQDQITSLLPSSLPSPLSPSFSSNLPPPPPTLLTTRPVPEVSSQVPRTKQVPSVPTKPGQAGGSKEIAAKKTAQVVSKAPKKSANQTKHKSVRKVSSSTGRQSQLARRAGGQNKGGEEVRAALLSLQRMRTDCTWVMCTRVECAKWRYLPVKDPSLVEEEWECKDNPDLRYGECGAPEQWWDQGLRNKFVENRFTVGSLVWARLEGWPAWPAMVDDDPDIGEFFWTGVRGGEWEAKPHQYHVVFFDAKEKSVSRAWVADRRLERLMVRKEMKGAWSERLSGAVEMAKQAGREDLETRRRKYCLAVRFKGPWGPVWPGWGVEDEGSEESDLETEEEICREMMNEVARNTSGNISLTNNEFFSDVINVVPYGKTGSEREGEKRPARTSDGDEDGPPVAKTARCGSFSRSREKSTPEPPNSPSKENVPPMNCAQLYLNRSLYTQELSQPAVNSSTGADQASFQSDGGEDEKLDSSLTRGMDKAMQLVDSLTPVKHSMLLGQKTPNFKNVLTPSNRQTSLLHPPSPALPSLPPFTPNRKATYLTSTPVRKSSLNSPHPLTSPFTLHSPTTKPLLSPGGDCHQPTPLPPPPDQTAALNTTSGSTAFSADGSFMEL